MGIRLKRSAIAGKAPLAGGLEPGELAVNTWDGKLYLAKNDGTETIVEVGPVRSVAGRTGAVTLARADVGLGNVDNTSDAAKPISTAAQTALDGKASTSHGHAIADVAGLQGALDGKQAADAGLTAIAGLALAADTVAYFTGSAAAALATLSAAGRALIDDPDAAAQRATLGLGTAATRNISVGTTAPGSPAAGDLWVDTN